MEIGARVLRIEQGRVSDEDGLIVSAFVPFLRPAIDIKDEEKEKIAKTCERYNMNALRLHIGYCDVVQQIDSSENESQTQEKKE